MEIITLDKKYMVRHFPYLHDFEIRTLTLDKEYIDYQLSEEFESLQDLVSFHIMKATGRNNNSHWIEGRNSIYITVCTRPYVWVNYSYNEILKRYLDVKEYYNMVDSSNYKMEFDNHKVKNWAHYTITTDANSCFYAALIKLQNRGLKTELKKLNSEKKFEIIHGLLTQQIKQYETSKQ